MKQRVCISVPHFRHKLTWRYRVRGLCCFSPSFALPLWGMINSSLYRRSLPHALCRASLCSLKVLACVEVSLSLPSVPLNGCSLHTNLAAFSKGNQREAERTRTRVGVHATEGGGEGVKRAEVANSCFVQSRRRFSATLYLRLNRVASCFDCMCSVWRQSSCTYSLSLFLSLSSLQVFFFLSIATWCILKISVGDRQRC